MIFLASSLFFAVASRTCPDGVERLNKLLASVDRSAATRGLAPYITFRKLQAEKDIEFQKDEPDSEKIAASWKALEAFVDEYPKSEDAAEAMLQLGIEQEFAGRPKAAAEWFGRIVKDHPGSPQASKAAGAKLRLESVGKPITFRGKSIDEKGEVSLTQLSGKVVVIHYWTTWCEVCKKDMETLKQLHSKYGKTGFQPIGVNLDNDKTEAISFLKENRLPWPQLFEPGGQEKSRLANDLGVHTLPTMILIDKHGKLISGNIHAGGLEAELKKLLK